MAKRKTETTPKKKEKPAKAEEEVKETKTETIMEKTEEDNQEDNAPGLLKETDVNAEEIHEEQEQLEPAKAEEEVKETKTETIMEKTDTTQPEAVESDIPSDVLKILKVFSNMEYLYIGKGGGVWRNGTPESIRGKRAVLYKNPYYKNN